MRDLTEERPPVSDIQIRETGPDDWRAWRTIRLRSLLEDPDAFGSAHDREAAFDEETWRSRADGTGGPAVLAYIGAEPVGMGAGWLYEPGKVMVVAMWTEPSWRGHGVGRRVLDHVVAWARQRDLRPDLWVADANPAARRLYERYGFRANGETASLREGTGLTMTRLVLPDGHAPR
ncbi:MAG: GNAT family N-acetyltransferase [Nocardioidaceae bacterium]